MGEKLVTKNNTKHDQRIRANSSINCKGEIILAEFRFFSRFTEAQLGKP